MDWKQWKKHFLHQILTTKGRSSTSAVINGSTANNESWVFISPTKKSVLYCTSNANNERSYFDAVRHNNVQMYTSTTFTLRLSIKVIAVVNGIAYKNILFDRITYKCLNKWTRWDRIFLCCVFIISRRVLFKFELFIWYQMTNYFHD